MKKAWAVYGVFGGTKYLGTFEAKDASEAEDMGFNKNGHVSLCWQCSREIDIGDLGEAVVEEAKLEDVDNGDID